MRQPGGGRVSAGAMKGRPDPVVAVSGGVPADGLSIIMPQSFFSRSFQRRHASSRPFLSPGRASGAPPPRMNPWPAPS